MEEATTTKQRFSPLLYSFLFTFTSILSFPQITLAQLRLGTGVQPGLEGYFLEYQQRGLPLNKLSGASGCSTGFGASCNKTGAILQKIVREYSGSGYQELLEQSAGGASNYQKFAQLYSNPSAVSLMPYSSFWRKGNEYVLDSYQNAGIGTLDSTASSSVSEIVSNFKYAPVTWGNENISLRQGIVGLKTSYGLTLVEEALKIPNIYQKIAEASINESEANFHQQQFQNAVSALNNQSPGQLTNTIFYLLSNPYTDVVAPLNRPNLGIPSQINQVEGVALTADVESILGITTEGTETLLASSFEEIIEGSATPLYTIAGVGGIALLILLASGDDSSNGNRNTATPVDNILASENNGIITSDGFLPENNTNSGNNNTNSGNNPPIVVSDKGNQANNNTEGVNALEIPEPDNRYPFLFLSLVLFLCKRKKVMNSFPLDSKAVSHRHCDCL